MNQAHQLIQQVAEARFRYLQTINQLTENQAQWKPSPEVWSAVENTEHLYMAELSGTSGIWKALYAKRSGVSLWQGDITHKGSSIEDIVNKTWQPKEKVPPIAAPRLGGPIRLWAVLLESLQSPLEVLGQELANEPLEEIIFPHPISGPLDVRQRLEFLRFHIDRHRNQVESLLKNKE